MNGGRRLLARIKALLGNITLVVFEFVVRTMLLRTRGIPAISVAS